MSYFEKWYNKTYPDTVGKHDAINFACRSSAAFGWEASGKYHEKRAAERIIKILENDRLQHVGTVEGLYVAIEEIKREFMGE